MVGNGPPSCGLGGGEQESVHAHQPWVLLMKVLLPLLLPLLPPLLLHLLLLLLLLSWWW